MARKIMIVIKEEGWCLKAWRVAEGRSARVGGFVARALHRRCRREVGHSWMYLFRYKKVATAAAAAARRGRAPWESCQCQ